MTSNCTSRLVTTKLIKVDYFVSISQTSSPPTPPMSSPESVSPPPSDGPVCARTTSSPDIIPHEVLQGISKIALVKNFNRRLVDDELKERRLNKTDSTGQTPVEHVKNQLQTSRTSLASRIRTRKVAVTTNAAEDHADALDYDDVDAIEAPIRVKKR